MTRAHFTVTLTNGEKYDANHISIERPRGPIKMSIVSFLCSGIRKMVLAGEIQNIEFHKNGAQWCSECDNQIYLPEDV